MEEKMLSGGAPLYGRRTATIDLDPLSVGDARQFSPAYDSEAAITAWSIYGRTPYYPRTIDPDRSLPANVQASILSERGLLYAEPEFLLRTELRQPNTYFSILRALAHGRRTPNEIAGMAGVEAESLSTYLGKLRRLRLIDLVRIRTIDAGPRVIVHIPRMITSRRVVIPWPSSSRARSSPTAARVNTARPGPRTRPPAWRTPRPARPRRRRGSPF